MLNTSSPLKALAGLFLLHLMAADASAGEQPSDPIDSTMRPDVAQLPVVSIAGRGSLAPLASMATGIRSKNLETPFSLSRVDSALLREQGASTLQDALRNVPGVQADSGFNGSHAQFFSIRGAVVDNGTGSSRVLRDGVRLSNYPYAPAFIEALDVLRGPGAAIGVRSEPGGTVVIRSRQAEFRGTGSLLVSVGRDHEQELSLDLNRVLSTEGGLAVRAIATRSNASEWRHVPDRLDGIKLTATQRSGTSHTIRAGIEITNQSYRPDYGLPALEGKPVDVPMDRQLGEPWADSKLRNQVVDLHADVAIADGTTWAFDITHLDAASTAVKNLLTGNMLPAKPAGTWSRISSIESGVTRHIDSVGSSISAGATFGKLKNDWFVGADYYKETLYQPSYSVSSTPPINVFAPEYGLIQPPASLDQLPRSLTTQQLEAVGLSLQDQLHAGDWILSAGLRWDRQNFRYGAERIRPVKESRWSPKIGILRTMGEEQSVYANLSTGTAPNQVASATDQSLPSRVAKQVEVGWKSKWLERQLDLDLAVFRLDQSNMISADLSTPGTNADYTLAGKARSQGFEISAHGSPTDKLQLNAAYAYTDAAYGQNAVYAGKRVPNVARHALNVWARYAWSDGVWTGLRVAGQTRRFADEANSTVLGGYGRVDSMLGWTTQSVQWQLTLRNLFDKQYYVSSHLHVPRWITPAEGRSWTITAVYAY